MTREIAATPDYALTQAWAAALHDTGRHGGIRYQTRHTTGARSDAAGVFGAAGQQEWPSDPRPLGGVTACRRVGIEAAHRPTRRQVRIVPAPGTTG